MVHSDHLEQPSFPPVAESLSTFSSACEHELSIRSLSFAQVEQLTLQTANTLAALRRYRNSLLPVSKLPPELLSRIFESAVAPTTPDSRRVEPAPCLPADSAVNIARVSSSWRAIAIASSPLWSYIVDNDIEWPSRPRMFLHRSRNAYIHVYTALPDSLRRKTHSVWPTIVHSHSDRVRELHLLIDRVYPIEDFLEAISVPLPSLEYLTMTAHSNSFFLPLEQSQQPPMILGGGALNLKAIALGPDAPFIPGNSFPSLVNLELRGMGRGVRVTTNALIDLLSNCPRLETFEIHFPLHDLVHNESDEQSHNTRPPLTLKHLKALWMSHVSATSTFAFLAQLELPAISTVRLMNLGANGFSSPPSARTLALILAHMRLTELDILEGGRHSGSGTPFSLHFLAHGTHAAHPPTVTQHARTVGLWVNLLFWRPPEQTGHRPLAEQYAHEERVFWDVLCALPTRAVSALRLSTLRATHLARAAVIIGGARGPTMPLESLVVRSRKSGSAAEQRDVVDHLARALGPYEGRRGVVVPVPAPRLGELTIELNRAWKPGMGDLLVRALEKRKARGYPLRSVACSALSVGDPELEGRIREHILGEAKVTTRKLWEIRKVPEVWMVKNDYWRLYPESLARTLNGWGLPENT